MANEACVWLDHRRAVIVLLKADGEQLIDVASDIGPRVRYSGAARKDAAEDQRDRRHAGQLDVYYDAVVAHLRESDAILVLGPGEAKLEFRKRLVKHGLGERVVAVETADKLTDREIADRAQRRFRAGRRIYKAPGGQPAA